MKNSNPPMKKAIIICGPTASGKTDFAHEMALGNNGEIVNADSMQIYKELPIITASPAPELRRQLPYHLYNFQDVEEEFSSAKYAELASDVIRDISKRGKLPIVVGGSGLYINMLINGYCAIPNIDEEVRAYARNLHKTLGAQEFFEQLKKLDPKIAAILNVGDTQRVIRAYEVVRGTGKSLSHFQEAKNIKPLPEFEFKIFLLLPERSFLYDTCNSRFIKLFQEGGLEEVRELRHKHPNLQTTASKALGVTEITAYIKGELTEQEAIQLASAKTRQYAKRQSTWFRNQIKEKQVIEFGNIDEYQAIKDEFVL